MNPRIRHMIKNPLTVAGAVLTLSGIGIFIWGFFLMRDPSTRKDGIDLIMKYGTAICPLGIVLSALGWSKDKESEGE